MAARGGGARFGSTENDPGMVWFDTCFRDQSVRSGETYSLLESYAVVPLILFYMEFSRTFWHKKLLNTIKYGTTR